MLQIYSTDSDNEDVYPQSGVIPFRVKNGEVEVLLITSRKARHWIFPKGLIEDGLSPQDSAEQEAFEEAGILGQVLPEIIGRYSYNKWGGVCEVEVYLMKVLQEVEDWPESFRSRKWVSVPEAASLVKQELKPFFENFSFHLKRVNG